MKKIRKILITEISTIVIGILFLFSAGFKKNIETIQLLPGTVTDYDGNIYHTVQIGSQVWMVENLKATHYQDGTSIPNAFDEDKWTNAVDGAYCMADNDSVYFKETYGLLYNYYAITSKSNLCPEGWHIPTEDECMTLINYLGGVDIAGSKLKNNSTNLWNEKNTSVANESGFAGLPAGGRGRLGSVGEVGNYATWWSSTSYDSLYAWHWGLYPDKNGIRSNPGHKASGFSVRCIKN